MSRNGLRRAAALAVVCCALPLSAAQAWSPETRVRMVDEAVRLMPASLRLALTTHRESVLRGMLSPMEGEGGPEHRPPWGAGSLDTALATRAEDLSRALGAPRPFTTVAEGFGGLAHFVADAGFPPQVSHEGGERRYRHFAGFCEARRQRFPLVFYGHRADELEQADWHARALEILERASAEDRDLARAYAAAGEPPDPAAFDDRSVPFAVGSLAYSHAITDIARSWLAAWAQAGGDLGRTPYFKRSAVRPPR